MHPPNARSPLEPLNEHFDQLPLAAKGLVALVGAGSAVVLMKPFREGAVDHRYFVDAMKKQHCTEQATCPQLYDRANDAGLEIFGSGIGLVLAANVAVYSVKRIVSR